MVLSERMRMLKAKMSSSERTLRAQKETAADFERYVSQNGVLGIVSRARGLNKPAPTPEPIGHSRILKDLDEKTTRKLHKAVGEALGFVPAKIVDDLQLDSLKSLLSDVFRFGGIENSIIYEKAPPPRRWFF